MGRSNRLSLDEIACNNKCGKGIGQHDYLKSYEMFFSSLRDKDINLLEMGIDSGVSLKIWREYFSKANIYGMDIDPDRMHLDLVTGCQTFIGSQSDKEFLNKVVTEVPDGFDIIIDDASHRSKDQITSFKYLFPYVNSGGLYVIEDLHVGYGNIGDYNKKGAYKTDKKNIIHFLKERVDDVNFHGRFRSNGYKRICKKNSSLNKYEKMIDSMYFSSGICFISKRIKK
jgi:hypothetical protein